MKGFQAADPKNLAAAAPEGTTLMHQLTDANTSFKAAAYVDASGNLTVQFAGTNPSNAGSVMQTLGTFASPSRSTNVSQAAAFGNSLGTYLNDHPGVSVTVVGYSEGAVESGVFAATILANGYSASGLSVTNIAPAPDGAALSYEAGVLTGGDATASQNLQNEVGAATQNYLASNDKVIGIANIANSLGQNDYGTTTTVQGVTGDTFGHGLENYAKAIPPC